MAKASDPTELWRTMLGEMSKGFQSFANQALTSPEFNKVITDVGGVSAEAQKQVGELMERYLVGLNMPSRAQLTDFGARLEAIETQLHEITQLLRQMQAHPEPPLPPAAKPPPRKRPPNRSA
ncbi:hypothetical protein HNR60_003369 [Rhodopseudomonas rhenobacensis]|uniref:Poly(R)-hydroxyalkanoic acid synthase subunit (PHA_synth_III_E) n=1 Tax=Rhodopseudomonas rhenobacensis TaxID=87461 RepID=A0A7W7Z5Z1_9BRAD|nr:hypothetical protein [Rhodopseudomonas rhenobacensis]MBB5048601.1 hypothetical protein [Rhodopseudomonas rhenobacensis]